MISEVLGLKLFNRMTMLLIMAITAFVYIAGCSMSAENPDAAVRYSYFPSLYDLQTDSVSGRLTVMQGNKLYYFDDGLESERQSGIYLMGDSSTLIIACDYVGAMTADEECLYFSTADSQSYRYHTLIQYRFENNSTIQKSFEGKNIIKLLKTENGLYALSSFSGQSGYNSEKNNSYFFFPNTVEDEYQDLLGLEFSQLNIGYPDKNVILNYYIFGNDIISYFNTSKFEIANITTGSTISSDNFGKITLYHQADNSDLIGFRLVSDTEYFLVKFNLTTAAEESVQRLSFMEDEAVVSLSFSHAVQSSGKLTFFNSINSLGTYTKTQPNYIMSYDIAANLFTKKAVIDKENSIVLYADDSRYALLDRDAQEEKFIIYDYFNNVVVKSDIFNENYVYALEASGNTLFFYGSSGYDGSSLENIYLKLMIKYDN